MTNLSSINLATVYLYYSIHFVFIATFYLDIMTKKNNIAYHIINSTQIFYWSSNILTENFSLLVLFIMIAHANSKSVCSAEINWRELAP